MYQTELYTSGLRHSPAEILALSYDLLATGIEVRSIATGSVSIWVDGIMNSLSLDESFKGIASRGEDLADVGSETRMGVPSVHMVPGSRTVNGRCSLKVSKSSRIHDSESHPMPDDSNIPMLGAKEGPLCIQSGHMQGVVIQPVLW